MAQTTSAVKTPDQSTQEYVPKDRARVLLEDARNLRYWAGRFGVMVAQLQAAIEVWGEEVSDLRLLLDLRDPQPHDPPVRAMISTEAEGAELARRFWEIVRTGSMAGRMAFGCGEAREFLFAAANAQRD
ncbi:MAG TPA: DUF3606 domain-containing protein [Chthoniobacteraceae bacterium]|jgi:hypothetical protein|nr:DUF3606 domain-containing protein [Chthoniobacteraceae bacterium]